MNGNDKILSKRMPGRWQQTIFAGKILWQSPTLEISIGACLIRPGGGPEPIEPGKRTLAFPTMKSVRGWLAYWVMPAIGSNTRPMLPMNSPSAFITAWFPSIPSPTAMAATHA